MSIENLKTMKEQLMSCVQAQLGDIKNTDAHELGQAIDMVKDLAEAIYYCTITESMEKVEKDSEKRIPTNINYYTTPIYNNRALPPDYYRVNERNNGYMYYDGDGRTGGVSVGDTPGSMRNTQTVSNMGGVSRSYYTEMPYGMWRDPNNEWRDPREGRSAIRRRMYMESKEMHKDHDSQLRELETYLQELSTDITEMIKDATPEEKNILRQKMTTLANKIS